MSNKGRSTPRVVCCAIPIARAAGKVLVITSRKRPNNWVCECSPPFAPPVPAKVSKRSTDCPAPHLRTHATSTRQCPKEDGSQQTGCWKQQPREKPWKKVSPFVHPFSVPIPDHSLSFLAPQTSLLSACPSRTHACTHVTPRIRQPDRTPYVNSGRPRQNHTLRDDDPVRIVNIPLLRARRRRPRPRVVREQRAQKGVGRLRGGRPEAVVEGGARAGALALDACAEAVIADRCVRCVDCA